MRCELKRRFGRVGKCDGLIQKFPIRFDECIGLVIFSRLTRARIGAGEHSSVAQHLGHQRRTATGASTYQYWIIHEIRWSTSAKERVLDPRKKPRFETLLESHTRAADASHRPSATIVFGLQFTLADHNCTRKLRLRK